MRCADQVTAGADGRAQGDGRRRVRGQRAQPGTVGAQHVSQDERVEPVVFSAGRPVTGPQVLHLPGGDHHYGQSRVQQRADQYPVAALDRGLAHPRSAKPGDQLADAGPVVRDAEPGTDLPGRIDDADGMVGAGPVDAGGQAARRNLGQNQDLGILHDSLLAAYPVGRHPYSRSRDARRQLTVRRSKAHGPVDDPRVPGKPPDPQNWHWTSLKGHDDEGGDRRHLGCTSNINHWRRNSSLTPYSPQQI